jgi:hypothetical protein
MCDDGCVSGMRLLSMVAVISSCAIGVLKPKRCSENMTQIAAAALCCSLFSTAMPEGAIVMAGDRMAQLS